MRVCLVNPPYIHPKSWGMPYLLPPLETAYIAALLERQHKVHILDAHIEGWKNRRSIDEKKVQIGLKNEEIREKIKKWRPDIVGIAVRFSGWSKTAYEISSIVKSIDKTIITVLYGIHPSARPEDCLTHSNVDFVIIREPEQTMFELVGALEQRSVDGLKKIRGIAFINNGKKVVNPPRPLIQNLDSLPFPARHLLPMNAYFAAVKERPLRGEIRKPWATMITSRGCPYHCVFCTSHTVMGREWRSRSPENVVDEIEQLVNNFNIKQIDFIDDNMTLNKKRMGSICELIMKRRLDIEWYTPNGVRADTLDENLLKKMKKSGCKKIRIAPESGVQSVVNQIVKKNLDLKEVEKAIVLSKKVGIKVGCFFVIGLIGETKGDIIKTINYAHKLRQLGADRFYFSIATPSYGTELYEQANTGGFLREGFDDIALSSVEPLIETPEFTADDLRELCWDANRLLNPVFTRASIIGALRDPKKSIKVLLGKLTA